MTLSKSFKYSFQLCIQTMKWSISFHSKFIVSEVQGSNRNLTDPRKTGKCFQNDIKMPKMKKEKEDKNDIGKFK